MFQLAAGSIAGTDHIRIGKNNQDAYYSLIFGETAIAVVCDGCGSGEHTEVGAKIGARLLVEAIAQILPLQLTINYCLVEAQKRVLFHLRNLAKAMGGHLGQTVNDHFLFTIVGVIITPTGAAVFSLGDGVIIINGKIIQLGPFPGNAPPYLAYALLDSSPDLWELQVHQQLPIDDIKSILIGTDGVNDLIRLAEQNLPGKTEKIGAISQFWEQDRYFHNPDIVRRRLALINSKVTKIDWENQKTIKAAGLLPDDTTLIAIRKQP